MVISTGSAKDISALAFGTNFHQLIGKTPYTAEMVVRPGTQLEVVDSVGDTVTLEEVE